MNRRLTRETPELVGEEIVLKGWVHARRNMGKLVFVDLRDRSGLVQLVFSQENAEVYAIGKSFRSEFVVSVQGKVVEREANRVSDAPNGKVEVLVEKAEIISQSETPPFEIVNEDRQANDELRLQYRYLDLRHERMQRNIKKRHQMAQFVRRYLSEQDFTEIHTPILSKSTPEGARDFLVPSRLQAGKFFALPQSPQQYKQLLMVAGFERYFQIAPCFRDEDARVDRAPGDFYQIDMELSFVTQDEILRLTEEMFTKLIAEVFPEKKILQSPWPRLTHAEVMEKYGTDKPDLRKNKDDDNELAFAWVLDFPLFVTQSEEDFFHGSGKSRYAPSHHMFTAPKEEDIPMLDSDPGKVRSYQHDLVLNGFEVGGGSMRIHQPEIQEKVFDIIGFTKEQKKEFRHLLTAFKYGVPPHGGIAPGFDRLLFRLLGETSIREIIPFPLTSDGRDPMMGSPSKVAPNQLRDLHIRVEK
ncbi:MAG: aspartate--tRNA ligase [Candidatus Nomurabacteria bacterium]|nr:MAG: aspartate--tRNA ligase [Candidatus Nomurabacteria bacterium]